MLEQEKISREAGQSATDAQKQYMNSKTQHAVHINEFKKYQLTLNKTKKKVNIHNQKHQRKIFTSKDKQNTIHSRLKI